MPLRFKHFYAFFLLFPLGNSFHHPAGPQVSTPTILSSKVCLELCKKPEMSLYKSSRQWPLTYQHRAVNTEVGNLSTMRLILGTLLVLFLIDAECRVPSEGGCKTRWFDRDNPSGVGDYETLSDLLKENPGQLCANPIDIRVRTLDGSPLQTSLIKFSDTTSGFGCQNKYDPPVEMCKDYEVQFTCPDSFCSVCTTRWFDRDDPSGKGDYETYLDLQKEFPGQLCSNPIGIKAQTLDGNSADNSGQNTLIQFYDPTNGFVCQNQMSGPVQYCKDYKVQFTCPASFCSGCKTRWFDRDNPSGYGDYETLSDLLKENPGELCTNPTDIEVRSLDGSPLQTSLIQYYDTTNGFACVNKLTPPEEFCKDYAVRFTCPETFCLRRGR